MDLVDNLLEDWCCNVGLNAYFHDTNCITIVIQNEILVCEDVAVKPVECPTNPLSVHIAQQTNT